MRITIVGQRRPIALDGLHVAHFAAGTVLDVRDSLGHALVRDGWAIETPVETAVETATIAPSESKVVKPKGKKGGE
jgi:hypothetical protein